MLTSFNCSDDCLGLSLLKILEIAYDTLCMIYFCLYDLGRVLIVKLHKREYEPCRMRNLFMNLAQKNKSLFLLFIEIP